MDEELGSANITQALTNEILIVAYDYNSLETRFFSKLMAKFDPMIYDGKMSNMTGASSAAPTFFTPKIQKNGYNLTEYQIDGGIICNNPALYAFNIAKMLRGEKKIRLMSLGTGGKTFTSLSRWIDKKVYLSRSSEFMMNIDSNSADSFLHSYYKYMI